MKMTEVQNINESLVYNSQGYPKREGEEVCSFFSKTGTCKFSTGCKWHHPEHIYPEVDFNSLGFPLRPDQPECEYYMKHQECKFGCICTKHHPQLTPGINVVAKARPFNATNPVARVQQQPQIQPRQPQFQPIAQIPQQQGQHPSRPGQPPCNFFLKSGACKFGATCKFDHPVTRAAAPVQFVPQQQRQQQQQPFIAPRAPIADDGERPIRPGAAPCAYYAKTGECNYGSTCKWDHSQGPQATAPQQQQSVGEPSGHNSLGFPLRPNSAPCAFFAKTGTCSYGGECKWNHPEEFCQLAPQEQEEEEEEVQEPAHRGMKPIPTASVTARSSNLPSRPGSQKCSFFLKSGTCSFGATCKFDHPETQAESAGGNAGPQRTSGFAPRATPY